MNFLTSPYWCRIFGHWWGSWSQARFAWRDYKCQFHVCHRCGLHEERTFLAFYGQSERTSIAEEPLARVYERRGTEPDPLYD